MTTDDRVKVWLTSDQHFGHKNIIEYCSRPFDSVFHMDSALTDAWVSKVSDDDVVVHVGDVTLAKDIIKYPRLLSRLESLPGKKVLVKGNHDRARALVFYAEQLEWRVVDQILTSDVLIVHKPPQQLPPNVSLVVHGHSHGKLKRDSFIDVGVDAQPGFAPIDASTILTETQLSALIHELALLTCAGVIPNTFIACGEGGNACGSLCFEDQQRILVD